jgi:sugar lactone lactonase YvrE
MPQGKKGEVEVLRAVAPEGCRVANGIAFSKDGSEMFFVDSPTRSVQRLEYSDENLQSINLKDPERFSSDPGEPHRGNLL